jgi:hypothetical protein
VFFRCRFERRIGGEELSIGLGVSVQIQIASVMGAVDLEFQQTVKIPKRILMLCGMECAFVFARGRGPGILITSPISKLLLLLIF